MQYLYFLDNFDIFQKIFESMKIFLLYKKSLSGFISFTDFYRFSGIVAISTYFPSTGTGLLEFGHAQRHSFSLQTQWLSSKCNMHSKMEKIKLDMLCMISMYAWVRILRHFNMRNLILKEMFLSNSRKTRNVN